MNIQKIFTAVMPFGLLLTTGYPAAAIGDKPAEAQATSTMNEGMMRTGLVLPNMNSSRGRLLFARKAAWCATR